MPQTEISEREMASNEIKLAYDKIEDQLVQLVPEIAPAAKTYWRKEGMPGEDAGPYIFFEDMFATFVEVLLRLPPSKPRDRLLLRAFRAVEDMLMAADQNLVDLAYIGMFEGRDMWWLKRSEPFLGAAATAELERQRPGWQKQVRTAVKSPSQEIVDIYGVRNVIAQELRSELADIPGRTILD